MESRRLTRWNGWDSNRHDPIGPLADAEDGQCHTDGKMRLKLKVKLVSIFAKYAKEAEDGHTWVDGPARIRDLAEYLELPMKRVRIVTVNGKQGDLETVLSDGDEVYIFPPAIGGG